MDAIEVLLLVRGDSSGALDALTKAHGGLSGLVEAAGKATLALGAVAVTVGGAAVKMAAGFQQSMTLIHTQAGDIGANLDQLKQQVLALAPQVGMGPDELAQGLYHIESAGFRGAASVDALTAAAKLSKIGMSDMADTTQAVVAVLAAYPQYLNNAGTAAAQLNAIVGTGDMRMQQLSQAMGTGVLSAANNFGLGLNDVGAALATLTDNVTPADEAATRLRMTFALLGSPSSAATKALEAVGLSASDANAALAHRDELEKYGVHLTDLASDMRQPNGLLVALQDLRSHLQKSGLSAAEQGAVISRAFGGGRTSGAIETLLNEFDRFQGKYTQIAAGTKNFNQAWAETTENFNFQVDAMKAGGEAWLISLGTRLLPGVTSVLKEITAHGPELRAFGDGVVNALTMMFGFLVNVFRTDVLPALQVVAQWVQAHLLPALQSIGSFVVTDVVPRIKQLATIFRDDVLPQVISFASWVTDTLVPQLISLGDSINDNVVPPLMAMACWIAQNVLPAAKEFAETVLPPLISALSDLADHFNIVGPLLAAFGAGWAALTVISTVTTALEAFQLGLAGLTAKQAVSAGISGGLTGIMYGLGGAITAANSAAETAYLRFLYLGDAIGKGASAAWGAVTSFAEMAASAVKNAAVTTAQWIASAATTTARWVMTAATIIARWVAMAAAATAQAAVVAGRWAWAAFTSRAPWINTGIEMIASFVRTAVAATINAASTAAAWVASGATTVASAVGSAAKVAAAWLAEKAQFAGDMAARLASAVASYAKMAAAALANSIKAGIAWAAEKAAFLAGMAVKVAVALGSYALMAAAAIGSAALAAAAWLLSMAPFILIGLAVIALVVLVVTHFTQIRDFIGSVVGHIADFFHKLWDGVVDEVKKLPGQIMDIFKDIGGWLVDTGKNLITGLWNGISGMGGWLAGKVKDFVLNAVPGPIRSALDIGSPSRLMAELVGRPVVQGIAKGMDDEKATAVNAATGVVHGILAGARGAAASGLSLVSGMGTAGRTGPAAAAGGAGAAGAGAATIGTVIINNPTSNVDVTTALQQQQFLAQMQNRGVLAGGWPASAMPAPAAGAAA